MGSNTRVDRSIGKKFGGLLEGLLGGLYDTSSLVANTDFSTKAPISSESGNLPYKGSGLFGGLKAKGANANFMAQNAMAELDQNRRLSYLKQSLPMQNDAAIALLQKQNELEQAQEFKKLGDVGASLGIALGNLPGNQLQSLNPPTTFKNPQEQASWYASAYGNLPVSKAPLEALNNANELQVKARPEVLNSMVNQEVNKGLLKLGDSAVDITGKTTYEGSGTDYEEKLIPITKTVLNPETGNMEEQVVSYKTERIPRRRQAGVFNLADYRITPDDVAANAPAGSDTSNYITTDIPPMLSSGKQPQPAVMQPQAETVSGQPANNTNAAEPQMQGIIPELVRGKFGFSNLLDMYQQNIAKPLEAPINDAGKTLGQVGQGIGDVAGNLRKLFVRKPTEEFKTPKFVDIGSTAVEGLSTRPLDLIPRNNYKKPVTGVYPQVDLMSMDSLNPYERVSSPMVEQPQLPQLTEEQLQALIEEINKANMYGQPRYGKPAAMRLPVAMRPASEFKRK